MERNLADEVVARYDGFLVDSISERASDISVEVVRLNDLLVKIRFAFDETAFSFRAMLSDQEEGIMMLVEERIGQYYILSGLGGSIFKKPNVHGGMLGSGSLFFHVSVLIFNGNEYNFHFHGKPEMKHKTSNRLADHLS